MEKKAELIKEKELSNREKIIEVIEIVEDIIRSFKKPPYLITYNSSTKDKLSS